ncbi:MAG: M56 family metallopeptidase [Haliscomenobacter sp.]|uniref:M56 family metallopeptidase n=1 Tax=Haliscomenobacter sp. TaxID=2717303 RepID=UPI0029B79EE2|nr:M56 family metallopeptidase [Haliscomenobacter sp.]MDX2067456.1 M56 family metallopeptidase [Haliscomenobacter sp.]
MNTLFAASFISERLLKTISWTLVHSLWQGLAMALLAALILLATPGRKALIRYNLLSALTLTFVAVAITTAIIEWEFFEYVELIPKIKYLGALEIPLGILDSTQIAQAQSWFKTNVDRLSSLFEQNQLILVSFWILILGLKSIKMGLDIWCAYRIRWYKTYQASLLWRNRLETLAAQSKVNRQVKLLESALVTGPATLGFLKPLILVPIGLMNNLPAEQVEAILLHELAHIRRSDYLVNFIQCLLENVFFFNPGLLWVSKLIRQERENCCDDLAVAAMKDKTLYINALVAFQEYKLHGAKYALAFAGQKAPLLDRVKRIINHHNYKTLSIMEKISLLATVLLISAVTFLSLHYTQAQTTRENRIGSFSNINVSGSGTASNPQIMFLQDVNGKTYSIKRVDKKIQEMYVNGEKLSEDKYAEYEPVLKEIDEQIERDRAQAELDRQQAERDREQALRDREQAERDREQAMRDQEQAKRDRAKAELDRQQADRDREQSIRDRAQAEKDRLQANLDREQAIRDEARAQRDREQAVKDRAQADRDRLQAEKDRQQAELDRQQAVKDRIQAEKDRKQAEEDRKMVLSMVQDMITDKLVKDKDAINMFRLTNDEFWLNGVKQSAELHAKYKAKYIKEANYQINYGKGGGNGLWFSKGSIKE